MAVAWLREIEEDDDEDNDICTGRFDCEAGEEVAERLPFDEAVAWARERADRAYADIEWERYVVVRDRRHRRAVAAGWRARGVRLDDHVPARVRGGGRR